MFRCGPWQVGYDQSRCDTFFLAPLGYNPSGWPSMPRVRMVDVPMASCHIEHPTKVCPPHTQLFFTCAQRWYLEGHHGAGAPVRLRTPHGTSTGTRAVKQAVPNMRGLGSSNGAIKSSCVTTAPRKTTAQREGAGPGQKKGNNGAHKKKGRGEARGTGTAEAGRGGTKLGSDLHPNSNKHLKRWDANSGRKPYLLRIVPLG